MLHYKKLVNAILIAYNFQPIKCKESANDNKEGLAITEPFNFFEDNDMDRKKTTDDNAISVEEFRRRNPNVELNALQVTYSNENVRRIEAFPTYSSVSMIDTAVTPYGYLQGPQAIICCRHNSCRNRESRKAESRISSTRKARRLSFGFVRIRIKRSGYL